MATSGLNLAPVVARHGSRMRMTRSWTGGLQRPSVMHNRSGRPNRYHLSSRNSAGKAEFPQNPLHDANHDTCSFLDDSNTDLIRWASDGNSFIVLDEDEFAKTLIPELFKHKNYASFVRQLNMYGFHKKVGLSDNSMRASEKRAKSPSEYYNPYFKRGRPELLWLIQKPKNEPPASKKKGGKKEDGADSEEPAGDERAAAKINGAAGSTDLVSLPRPQWQALQREIDQLKRSQQQINSMIARFQHENNNYIRQASVQHERHENSINAILTFLATFYHRNLDGQGPGMFPGAIPNNQPQTGNVYDMGEFEDGTPNPQVQLQKLQKKPLALLAPPSWTPDPANQAQAGVAGSASPSSRASTRPASRNNSNIPQTQSGQRGSTLRDSAVASAARTSGSPLAVPKREHTSTPNAVNRFPDGSSASGNTVKQPQHASTPSSDDILTAINNVNANTDTASHGIDFSSALRQYENANGNAPLTPEQRDNMLHMMANTSGTTTPNQLISRPAAGANAGTSGLDADSLAQYASNTAQLDMLQRLQQEQDSKVQSLADRLQPLSPSGSIPGLNLPSSQPGSTYDAGGSVGNPGDFDMNSFINSDYFPDFDAASNGGTAGLNGLGAGGEPDFGFADDTAGAQQAQDQQQQDDNANDNDDDDIFGGDGADVESPEFAGGHIVGSVGTSSGAPTPAPAPAAGQGATDDGDGVGDDGDGGARKRRRRG